MTGTARSPFDPNDTPATILLANPPLVRVLAQVRFAPVLAVASESFVGPFQQALADRYPIGSSGIEFAINIPAPAEGPPTGEPTRLWRFETVDESSRVTLATSFVAFETDHYEGHTKFLAALSHVLDAVDEHIKPVQTQRTGIRYVQQLAAAEDLGRLSDFFRTELLGVVAAPEAAEHLDLCLTQARHVVDGVTLAARWGMLPAGMGTDIVQPVDGPSWLFDIDVFDEERSPFDAEELAERAGRYTRRQYQFFRWAVEPAFLERFGAAAEDLAELRDVVAR
ncbi:hypothetical protein BH20ACT13_BH20ACT13_23100 [soil metagenome]